MGTGREFAALAVSGVLRVVLFLYDVITYLPLLYFSKKRLADSNCVKAKQTGKGRNSPWRCVESLDKLTTTVFEECVTLDEWFERAVLRHGERLSLGTRELLKEEDELQPNGRIFKKVILGDYKWLTFDQVNQKVDAFGCGLAALGQQPYKNVVIYAETRAEWMIAAQACFRFNFPIVTLYSTLGEDAIIHGINESEAAIVITTQELLPKFKNAIDQIPNVRHIVYMDAVKMVDLSELSNHDLQLHAMSNVLRLGMQPKNASPTIQKPVKSDLAMTMYTSGSTGLPKGVMMTHLNLMSAMSGQNPRMHLLGKRPNDTYIGYLPLAHVLELTCELSCIGQGVKIGYSSPLTLSDQSSKIKRGSKGDVSILKPTLMAAVPVIMDRIYKNVWDKVNEGSEVMRQMFKTAYNYKLKQIENGSDTPIFNKIVFKRIRKILGGKVRLMLSGGAPLSPETQRFINICFCCPVLQGYALTETCGAGTVSAWNDLNTGLVGAPMSCNEIMLVDWDEGGYRSTDDPFPRGEILIGGNNVTMGYYKRDGIPDEFMEINGQRWFSTGDIGEIDTCGSLRIIDRKKDLVKLQAGEYVSLAKVETIITISPFVDSVCVFGDSSKTYVICFIVPNKKQISLLAKKLQIATDEWEELCSNQEIETAVMKNITDLARKGKLERFEVPQKIKLVSENWTPDTGLVTDAFKLKRKCIEAHYQSDITRMYA